MQVTFELPHRNCAVKTRAAIGARSLTLSEPINAVIERWDIRPVALPSTAVPKEPKR
jgi:2-phospho-L-lactate transferase/gluconeogenesis factor (CofD/UPF0052 family)